METRGKGAARLKTAEVRLGQKGTAAFLDEANVLLPGPGTDQPQGNFQFTVPVENIHDSGNTGFSFRPNLS
jgi:hypothetical protein